MQQVIPLSFLSIGALPGKLAARIVAYLLFLLEALSVYAFGKRAASHMATRRCCHVETLRSISGTEEEPSRRRGRNDLRPLLSIPGMHDCSDRSSSKSCDPSPGMTVSTSMTPSPASKDDDSLLTSTRSDSFQESEWSEEFAGALRLNSDFIIQQADESVLELLKFKREELIGKSIMELMSPAVADAHKHIFRSLKCMAPQSVCEVGRRLIMSSMSRCRVFAVLDANKEAAVCNVSVILRPDLSSKVILQSINDKIVSTVPHGFGRFINDKPGLHVRDFNDVTCVMMDVAGSTRFSQSQPPSVMAELFHRIYVIANAVVMQEAFPFAYIHEIVGDSLLLLINAGFMVQYPSKAAAIGSHVARQIQCRLDVMLATYSTDMYVRVGIAVGPVTAGVVDGRTFRVFGSTVHLSQRLESLCPRSKVACSTDFLEMLRSQVSEGVSFDLLESEAKGFGCVKYATLQFGIPGRSEPTMLAG